MKGLDINTIVQVVGFLSIAIGVITKLKPGIDPYFQKTAPILAEVDDLIDVAVVEFPEVDSLQTVDEIMNKVVSELEEAGYNLDKYDKKKIENRVKAKVGNLQNQN